MTPDTGFSVPRDEFGPFWPFHPSFETNLCIAALFGLSTGIHVLQAILHRTDFCWVIVMGGLWETFAFVLRTLGSQNGTVPVYYIISSVLFNLAPLWINAFLYMMAARLIYYCLPDHKVFNIHATTLAKTFVCLDIVCFLGQAGGGAVMQKSGESDEPENMWKLGHGIYIFGCAAQLCFLALFAVLMVAFRRKVNQEGGSAEGTRRVIFLEAVIYVILLLITVRVTYRLIEFGQGTGHDNPIISNENYAIFLDAVPMIVAFFLLNAGHPGIVMRGVDGNFGRGKEKHELLQDEDRPTSGSRLVWLRNNLEEWRYNYDLELRDLRR